MPAGLGQPLETSLLPCSGSGGRSRRFLLWGREIVPPREQEGERLQANIFERNLTFYLGLGILIMVPAFKTITHLPPFMGILFGLGILWMVRELVHRGKEDDEKKHLTLVHALMRI